MRLSLQLYYRYIYTYCTVLYINQWCVNTNLSQVIVLAKVNILVMGLGLLRATIQ